MQKMIKINGVTWVATDHVVAVYAGLRDAEVKTIDGSRYSIHGWGESIQEQIDAVVAEIIKP